MNTNLLLFFWFLNTILIIQGEPKNILSVWIKKWLTSKSICKMTDDWSFLSLKKFTLQFAIHWNPFLPLKENKVHKNYTLKLMQWQAPSKSNLFVETHKVKPFVSRFFFFMFLTKLLFCFFFLSFPETFEKILTNITYKRSGLDWEWYSCRSWYWWEMRAVIISPAVLSLLTMLATPPGCEDSDRKTSLQPGDGGLTLVYSCLDQISQNHPDIVQLITSKFI